MDAWVLAVGDESLVLSVPQELPGGDRWTLTSDARFIHERLLSRLEELHAAAECDELLLQELVDPDPLLVDDTVQEDGGPGGESLSDEQAVAARRAMLAGIRFTWGPPGTGKTRVLGSAVASAASEGKRVLVLAHSNVAVDVAIERVADELGAADPLIADGRVVRAGTPQSSRLAARHELIPERLAGAASPELVERLDRLREELRDLSDESRSAADVAPVGERISAVRAELREGRAELEEASRRVIDEASVVATTLSRAVIDEQIWSAHFDVVVIDEASMAPLPIVLALVLKGATTVSFFGDFRQLPPIAISEQETARAYFAKDVFEYAQVIHLHELGATDHRLTALKTQYRMGDAICGVVNELAYDNMLRTAPQARNAAISAAERGVGPGHELVVIDTAPIGAVCDVELEPDSWSRVNLAHAMLASSLAQCLRADGFDSVGVISPYRVQAQLLGTLLRTSPGIEAATIHRFQGSECDAIVLDLTDAEPQSGPSRLTGKDAELARRLINVAVSRARHKLVVLADRRFIEAQYPAVIVRTLVDLMDDRDRASVDGADVTRRLVAQDEEEGAKPGPGGPVWAADWSAVARLLAPVLTAGTRLEANVVTDAGLAEVLAGIEPCLGQPAGSIVRAAGDAARSLELTGFDLRLHLRGNTPWVILDETVVAVGSEDSGPVAVVSDRRVVQSLRNALAPTEARG